MNRSLRSVALLLMIVCISFGVSFAQTITLLHLNDTHSHLDAYGPKDAALNGTIGGVAKAATYIGMTKMTEPNVLVLHAGDAFVGDLFFNKYFGIPELRMLSMLGVDAMTIGNHEFDFGPEYLQGFIEAAYFNPADPEVVPAIPLISANLDFIAFPTLDPYIAPSVIKEIDGVKIGIFGLTVPGNPTTNSAPVQILENVGDIAYAQVTALRTAGCQVVILLSHLGIYGDRQIAAGVPGIDMIIGGHDHLLFTEPEYVINAYTGLSVPVCQVGSMYQNIGKMKFTVSESGVTIDSYEVIPLNATIPAVPEMQAAVDDLKAGIVEQYGDVYHTVVANACGDLEETFDSQRPFRDTHLGNIITDAYRWKTGTEISLTALGLIAEKIYAGPIVGADIFRAVSYGYDPETGLGLRVVTGRISGAELLEGLEIGLAALEITDDFCLQVSGMAYMYDSAKPVGQRLIIPSVRIDGKMIKLNKNYNITINEGIVAVLGGYGVEISDLSVLPVNEYTVLRDYMAKKRVIIPKLEGRILDRTVLPWRPASDRAKAVFVRLLKHFCYPNPFNPMTTVAFEIPEPTHVTLKVYNMIGQVVATLADEELVAGSHQRTFDGTRLTSGVYFYRLQTGNTMQTEKMVLMK